MKTIDVHEQISRIDFENLTKKMLDTKIELQNIASYIAEPETLTNYFVEEVSEIKTNREATEIEVFQKARNKYYIYNIIIDVFCLALYGAFYILFPIISGIALEDAWLFYCPIILVTIRDVLLFRRIDKNDRRIKKIIIAVGIILLLFGALAVIFEFEATGMGDTAAFIAYCVIALFGLIIPRCIIKQEKIFKKIKSTQKYKNELKNATQKDEIETKKLLASAEMKFQKYVKDYTQKRNEVLSKASQLKAEWSCYEDFYKEWEKGADRAQKDCEHIVSSRLDVNNIIYQMNMRLFIIPPDSIKSPVEFIQSALNITREMELERSKKDIESDYSI